MYFGYSAPIALNIYFRTSVSAILTEKSQSANKAKYSCYKN